MNNRYTLFGNTVVPNENGEICRKIRLYKVDDEQNSFLWDLMHLEADPVGFPKEMKKMGCDPSYIDELVENATVKSAVLSDLDLVEEPDYAVPPGGMYHRYSVCLLYGVVVVDEEIALNV